MELEDLVLKRYRVERRRNRMIAIEHPRGRYKADSAEKVEKALSQRRQPNGVFVLIGPTWHPIRH